MYKKVSTFFEKPTPKAEVFTAITAGEKEDSSLTPQELLEEERRLGYVCLTRAKKYLYLSSPKVHRNKDVEISRFLLEGLGINKK